MTVAGMNEPLAVREAPASYVLEAQPVGRASARLPVIPQGYKQTEVGGNPPIISSGQK